MTSIADGSVKIQTTPAEPLNPVVVWRNRGAQHVSSHAGCVQEDQRAGILTQEQAFRWTLAQ